MFKTLFTVLFALCWCTFLLGQEAPNARDNIYEGNFDYSQVDPNWIYTPTDALALLYDNGPAFNIPGGHTSGADLSLLETALGMNTLGAGHQWLLGYRVADEFTVPTGETWTIDSLIFYAYQTNSTTTSTITGVYFQIWDGDPSAGGTIIWGDLTTNRLSNTYWSNIYRASDNIATNRPMMRNVGTTPALVLTEGTYWIDWSTDGSLASGPWAPPIVILGQTTTGNAQQFITGWLPLTDSGTLTPMGLPFEVWGTSGGGAIDKLLLTEFVVTPTGGEFIEIYNPNASPVDLTNYFVSDVAFDGGPEYYYHIVLGLYEGGFGDFMSKFPDGATIGAGEHQIIALNGDADFLSTYGVNPTYEIDQAEFQSGPPDGIPDMMETHPGSIYGADSTHNPGLTNSDEMVMLFFWDGMSDLVGDVDYVLYNSGSPTPNDEAVDKTGITIDGPDPGTTGSTYLNDTPVANQLSALSPTSGFSAQREDYTEGVQVMSGGNGVTGSDETSEDMNNTWIVDIPSPFDPVPVELTSFTASVNEDDVTLYWTTATELNNLGFEIQRNSGNDYQTVGFVNGHGTTTETQEYSFTDVVTPGSYSYRLKQVDFDGTFEYSDAIEVDVSVPDVFALEQNYPNPFNPSTIINFSLAVDSKVSLKVFDVLGQEVATLINSDLVAGAHNVDFNASSLNSGVYFYRIEATGIDGTNFTNVKKMILTK